MTAEGDKGRRPSRGLAAEADSQRLAKADIARQLNVQIRVIAASLTEAADASEEVTFYCECGCLRPLVQTLATFDAAGGALHEGHSRPRAAS